MRTPDVDALDLKRLRILVVVAEERSVSQAALRLGVSQSTVSRGLARLRAHLADDVFVRTPSGLVPTDAARAWLPLARKTLAEWDQALAPVAFDPASSAACLRLAAWDYVLDVALAEWWHRISSVSPLHQVRVHPLEERFPTAALESGELDAVVGLFRDVPPGCFHRDLWSDTFVLAARPGHPQLDALSSLGGFAALPHLLVSPYGKHTGFVDDLLREQGLKRHVALQVPSFVVAASLIEGSDLVALLPAKLLRGRSTIVAHPVPFELPPFTVQLVWHERTRRHAGQRWLRDQLWLDPDRRP